MPTAEPIADELLLAATERAEHHKRGAEPGVLIGEVIEHIGLRRGSGSSRRVRPRLDALYAAGLLDRIHRRGSIVWTLTGPGRRRLGSARRTGKLGELPESPQHRAWRAARAQANERSTELRADLGNTLGEANSLFEVGDESGSAAWFELAERLQDACWRYASATYCLGEWIEPDDTSRDVDQPARRQRGRRETRRWDRRSSG
jgi:hypothetical protein